MTMTTDGISARALADHWDDISPRRIQQLAADGILPKISRGKYPRRDCTRAYIRYLKGLVDGTPDTSTELGQVRLKKEKLEVRRREIELGKLTGTLLPVEFMVEEFGSAVRRFRAEIDSIPARHAADVYPEDPGAGQLALEVVVEELLKSLLESFAAVTPELADDSD